ncbi:ThiF family adenylyltransferase [uncultured Prevotella sp.]|uniref:HesA/MoeB/ThiF family protein n=1 Tax=uncultured Prevotella sp. TaxID=159272 RepID=UPI0025DC4F50|nr:ThiF family adenylyltransferase [uncultured Prevotella sp.]
MKSFRLETKREPRIALPSSMSYVTEGVQYVGVLKGYYVPNTNYYNILPQDVKIEREKSWVIGEVLGYNPLEKLTKEELNCIRLLDLEVDYTKTKLERFRTVRSQATSDELVKKVKNILQENISLRVEPSLPGLIGWWENQTLHLLQIDTLREVKIESYALQMDIFSRNVGILESTVMLQKKAVFVGCGSVGSLVAVELAKAGVGNFMLIDNDVFGYHNICRHQCGIYDVGHFKTDALADRIFQINPYATVMKKNCMIQEIDRGEKEDFCNEDTIIIGGADNREGDLYASDFALENKMPFISIGCWERAFAGEIFYCLPNGMPTYRDFLKAMGYISGRVTQNRRFYTTEEDLEKVSFEPGISADVNFITIIGVKIILDLLNRSTPGFIQRLVPYLTQYTLVCNTNNPQIGGEQAEIFKYPLQVTTSIYISK